MQDGKDRSANSPLRKLIDGDETLLIALDEGYAPKGSIAFSRIEGVAGNDVEIVLRKDGVEVFKAEYDLTADATPDFGGVIFDAVAVSAAGVFARYSAPGRIPPPRPDGARCVRSRTDRSRSLP